tara:strand:+ start:326 stop:619 length:294 start_codon:yes stop_codon:yes gene_type:complete
MNRKKYKKIKRQAELIAIEWLYTLVSDEEAKKITLKNHHRFMPVKSYFNQDKTTHLTTYHPRWIQKQVKYLLRNNPKLRVEDITLEAIEWKINRLRI